jgi:hypothetical protein
VRLGLASRGGSFQDILPFLEIGKRFTVQGERDKDRFKVQGSEFGCLTGTMGTLHFFPSTLHLVPLTLHHFSQLTPNREP